MTVDKDKFRMPPAEGTGVATSFPYDFLIQKKEDFRVYYTTGVGDQLLTVDTDYTVTGAGDPAGGTVDLVNIVPQTGEFITIVRESDKLQEQKFGSQLDYSGKLHEDAHDKRTINIQDYQGNLSFTIRGALTDPDGLNYILPGVTERRETSGVFKYLTFDSDGNAIVNTGQPGPPGDGTLLVTQVDTARDFLDTKVIAEGSLSKRVEEGDPEQHPAGYQQLILTVPGVNFAINGDMAINQRDVQWTTPNQYTVDRMDVRTSAAPANTLITQEEFSPGQTEVPGEPSHFLRMDKDSGSLFLAHRVEDVRTFADATCVLSWWGRARTATTHSVTASQVFGSGGSPSVGATNVQISSTAVGTVFAFYTAKITFASISGKTLGTGHHVVFNISPAQGDNHYDVSELKIERGEYATSFVRPDKAIELAKCKRFFEMFADGRRRSTEWVGDGRAGSATRIDLTLRWEVEKRGVPSVVVSNASDFAENTGAAFTGFSADSISEVSCQAQFTNGGAAFTPRDAYNVRCAATVNARLRVDAEL